MLSVSYGFGDIIWISGKFLLIPLTIHLTLAYRRLGWWIVAMFGTPFIFQDQQASGIYIAALLLGAWLSSGDPGERIGRLPGKVDLRILAGMVLFTFAIGLGTTDLYGRLWPWLDDFRLGANLYPLFLLLVLALGAGGAAARAVLPSVAIIAVVGAVLDTLSLPVDGVEFFDARYAEIPPFGLVPLRSLFLHHLFDTPADFITAAIYFYAGRNLSQLCQT
ncbi:hypothetical protein N8071_00430, partial [bacterium]|nr:hypothetical protein [bacterium]